MEPLEAIQMELDAEDDASVAPWFYDHKPLQHSKHVNGTSYRKWRLPVAVMSNLHRLGNQVRVCMCRVCESLPHRRSNLLFVCAVDGRSARAQLHL